jgi:hypothetical protein
MRWPYIYRPGGRRKIAAHRALTLGRHPGRQAPVVSTMPKKRYLSIRRRRQSAVPDGRDFPSRAGQRGVHPTRVAGPRRVRHRVRSAGVIMRDGIHVRGIKPAPNPNPEPALATAEE